MTELLATACGLLLVVEGIPWFLSPRMMRNLLRQLTAAPDPILRFAGLIAMGGGLLVIYLARG